jgi:hypothetical protein
MSNPIDAQPKRDAERPLDEREAIPLHELQRPVSRSVEESGHEYEVFGDEDRS